MLVVSIIATIAGAIWFGFILAHYGRSGTQQKAWDQQVSFTRHLIQLQRKP